MGVVLSSIGGIRALIAELRTIIDDYNRLKARVRADPGVPVQHPTRSFWMHPPAQLPATPRIPSRADVVIIGSGITAASIARTLLGLSPDLVVVVLDARDACSGATGRNGGHVKPYLYEEYGTIKDNFGAASAKKIIRFRQAHLPETIKVAAEEGVLEASGAREVESLDVHYDAEVFAAYKQRLLEWRHDMPEESSRFDIYEGEHARQTFHLGDHCKGVIVGPAGALHPYRLISAIWKRLITDHQDNFFLCTNTPCTAISGSHKGNAYTLTTPRGLISAQHVVHASNAYVSHLLPKMREKIIPARATCTAQRPGRAMSNATRDGGRSWLLYGASGYDYLTQLPKEQGGALILGGGFMHAEDGVGEVARTDDSSVDPMVGAYLGGALPAWFGARSWGAEALVDDEDATDEIEDGWNAGRVKAMWSGILSVSADRHPWVGRVPEKIAQRRAPAAVSSSRTAAPGEWISAGYSGDGMSAALLSGRAVAYMILGREHEFEVHDWLPEPLVITQKRWAKAKAEDLLSETRVLRA